MSDPVATQMINNDMYAVPAPDMLCVGPKGAHHTDIVRLLTDSTDDVEIKRGTLLMSGTVATESGYVVATEAGLATDVAFVILADDVTMNSGQHADIAAYFEGDFDENAVIFTWETDNDDHAEIVEAAREPLRKQKIFLREVTK
jgi:hypothetical protein